MASSQVAYNPADPVQQSFLSALALGETGNSSYAAHEGVGGTNLSGLPTDQYGFPQWSGQGNSHAAGIYQFQPQTWDAIAAKHNLNFNDPQDQNAAAWYTAQQADPNLMQDLQSGNYGYVQSALSSIWPSVTGNQASPTGLAGALSDGQGADIPGGSQAVASPTSSTEEGGGWFSAIENWLLRGGLILIGGMIVIIALYFILSNNGYIPKVSTLAKDV